MSDTHNDLIHIQLKSLISLASPARLLKRTQLRPKASQQGGYVSGFKGRGMEFEESRPYQSSDDIRNMDWKITARTNKPHTKLFREERERPIFVSVDLRHHMHFATRGVFKSVQAAKLASLIAWMGHHHGDRIGGQCLQDHGYEELKPKSGKHAVLQFLNSLCKTPIRHTSSKVDFKQAIDRLSQHAHPSSAIYIISDFRDMSDQTETALSRLARHTEVTLIHVYDPIEHSLPKAGRYRVTDSIHSKMLDIHSHTSQTHHAQFERHQATLRALCTRCKMTLLTCETTQNPLDVFR